MLLPVTLTLLALAFSAQSVPPTTPSPPSANVRVTARILVVEQGAFTRAGLDYVIIGHDRVRVGTAAGRSGGKARVQVGTRGPSLSP